MFRYLNFESVVITCGTCKEALDAMGCAEVFDCPVQDINFFLSETSVINRLKKDSIQYFYHQPCHDSLEEKGLQLLEDLFEAKVVPIPHCCSEAGTMSLSRPDITHAMLVKKADTIREKVERTSRQNGQMPKKSYCLITNCPSCLQGLGRQQGFDLEIRHLTTELAALIGGGEWEKELRQIAQSSEAVRF